MNQIKQTLETVARALRAATRMANGFDSILNGYICAGALSLAVGLQPGMAATFNVANSDVPGLIAAINTANGNGQANTINLAAGGTYTLTAVDNGSTYFYTGPNGLPTVNTQMTINGNGATIQRSSVAGTPDFRIFEIASGDLTLNSVTVQGGRAVAGAPGYIGGGSGLRNDSGKLLLVNCTITGNGTDAGENDGGGIFNNYGTVAVLNSTINGNTSFGGYGGGGILNFGTTTIVNSTIFDNRADAPPGARGRGDAIAGQANLKNSILASPTRGYGIVCYGTPTSLGHNIAGDASCSLTGSGDLNSTNPLLGPLASNDGLTQSDEPLAGSPAIDAVPIANCTDANGVPIATDQRGIARPQGAACDIGAVEFVVAPELFWGLTTPPQKSNDFPNMVWFDLDGIPGPPPAAATPPIPIPSGAWTAEGTSTWMDAVQAPGQPAVFFVLTTGYLGALRAFRVNGSSFNACGSYPLPVDNGENGGVRVAYSGAYALAVWGSPSTGSAGSNLLWKFPLNLSGTGDCITGAPTQIPVPSNPIVRSVDFNPVNAQEAVVSGYGNIVTFVNPVSGATICNVPLVNNGTSLTRLEARYRPNGAEVWASSYDARQIAVIRPPGGVGGCTVAQFITAGFGALDNLAGGSFHPDPSVPAYYIVSYPGGHIFALDSNTKSIISQVSVSGAFGATAVTRGPAYRLQVPVYGCCPQFAYTNAYDVSTLSKASDPFTNLIGAHASSLDMTTIATLRDVGKPDLTITKTHIGNFTQGQTSATFTITVTNSGGGPTAGMVTVSDDLSGAPGLMPVSFASTTMGSQWLCTGTTCTRSDPLAAGASYDPLQLTVSVAGNAASPQVNHASVSGGAEINTFNDTATDTVVITQLPDLKLAKAHVGTGFTQGQQGAQYTLTVNNGGTGPTTRTITVTDMLPGGLTFVSGSGGGFSCSASGQLVTCTNSATPITASGTAVIQLNVNVSTTAAASLMNSATVACTCAESSTANNTSNTDTVNVTQLPDLTIAKAHVGANFAQAQQGAEYILTVTNSGAGPTNGTITVTDMLPSGLTFVSGSAVGFSCSASGPLVTCTSAMPIAASGGFAAIALIMNVSPTAAASLLNSATVACICAETNTANNSSNIDTVTVAAAPPASTPFHGWAVGSAGTILHTSDGGNTWSTQTSGTSRTLWSVSFVDANTGWAVGETNGNGTVLHTTNGGSTWSPQTIGPEAPDLFGVSFVDANNGWAVGDSVAAIVHTSNGGSTWSYQASGAQGDLHGVSFVDVNNGWAVGLNGVIVHTSNGGNTWSSQNSRTSAHLVGVSFADANNGWAVGGSTILHTTNGGSTWSVQYSGTSLGLSGIRFLDANTGWAVGGNNPGIILHTTNGGNTWSSQISGTVSPLIAISFADANNGLVVGSDNFGGHIERSNTGGSSWSLETSTANDLLAVTTVRTVPDLTIAKAHVGTGFTQGQQGAQYTLTVSNGGAGPTTGTVTVTDTLPGGLTFVSGSGGGFSCSASGQLVTCIDSAPPIAASGTAVIQLNVNVSTTAGASLMNSAAVACTCAETSTANNTSNTDTVSVTQLPDLTITKQHIGGNFAQGQQRAAYRISVANVGTGAAVGSFAVTDMLPSGLTYAGFDGASNGFSCSASGQRVTCTNSGPIPPYIAPNFLLYVNVSATAPASLTNSATVACICTEINTANNISSPDTVTVNPIVDLSGRLSVTYAGFGRNVATGLWVTTLTVTNTGTAPVSGPIQVVLNNLSSNATMVNNNGLRNGNPYITVSAGALAPRASVTATIQFANPSNGFINFTPEGDSGVFPAAPLGPVFVTPNHGSGLGPQKFYAQFTDPNGASDLQIVDLDFGSSAFAANSCIVAYVPASAAIYLFTDNNSTTSGPGSTLSNGQCTVSAGAAIIAGNNLTVPFTVTFNSGYTGSQIYGLAQTNSGSRGDGWLQLGAWTAH